MMKFLQVLCGFISYALVTANGNPEVSTTSGIVIGATTERAHVFYGIPYAEPPIGNLRWKDPVPIQSPRAEKTNASVNTHIQCHQNFNTCVASAVNESCQMTETEDCLVLNVFTPRKVELSDPGAELLPVMFYIHGGGFTLGAGSSSDIDGQALSNVTNTVVVTVNYRLGPLGFLVLKELDKEDINGNQGLKDQRVALQWVQQNIANFSGDVKKVMIFGNSAGAQSVMFHTISPFSKDLFSCSIQQSNPVSYSFIHPDMEGALRISKRLSSTLGCNEAPSERECLLNATAEAITARAGLVALITAEQEGSFMYKDETFLPVIDGVEFIDLPLNMIQSGNWSNDKNLILGVNTEESQEYQYYLIGHWSKAKYLEKNQEDFGNETGRIITDKYMQLFPPEDEDYRMTYAVQQSHYFFDCPNQRLARYTSTSSNADVYFYTNTHPVLIESCVILNRGNKTGCYYATHASEVRYVFKTVMQDEEYDNDDEIVENEFSTYWGNFAHQCFPSKNDPIRLGNFSFWPTYSPSASGSSQSWSHLVLGAPTTEVASGYKEEICDFWESINYAMPDKDAKTTPAVPATTSSVSPTTSKVNPKVQTTSGLVIGTTNNEAHAFYGIPYAQPPVGVLRWKDPQPIDTPRTTKINATVNNHVVCHQNSDTHPAFETEDCLVLNVFVPRAVKLSDPAQPLPVMFYIHGGGFKSGSGTSSDIDGKSLSNATNTVVVTINYRLGPLGFLSLREPDKENITGNQGLKDQRLALQWVQDNIAEFSGDRNRVMIHGNSAGAQSVMFHLISPLSKDLFSCAIQQSNPVPYAFIHPDVNGALRISSRLSNALGCDHMPSERDCLLNTSADMITAQSTLVERLTVEQEEIFLYRDETFLPIIDGIEFTDLPLNMIQSGNWNKEKNVIIGINTEELYEIQFYFDSAWTKEYFLEVNQQMYGNETGKMITNKYIELFPPDTEDYRFTYSVEQSHYFFDCPNQRLAKYTSLSSNSSVYFYTNAHPVLIDLCAQRNHGNKTGCHYASHTSEIRYIFRTASNDEDYDEDDEAIEKAFGTYWGNFAHSCNPSSNNSVNLGEGLAAWPRYSQHSSGVVEPWSYLAIEASTSTISSKYKAGICEFWESINYGSSTTNGPTASPMPPDEDLTTSANTSPTILGRWAHVVKKARMLVDCIRQGVRRALSLIRRRFQWKI